MQLEEFEQRVLNCANLIKRGDYVGAEERSRELLADIDAARESHREAPLENQDAFEQKLGWLRSWTLRMVADSLRCRGIFDPALDICYQSLSEAQSSGAPDMEAHAMVVIGLILREQSDIDRAFELTTHALDIYTLLKMESHMALAISNLANIKYSQGNYSEALDLMHQSLDLRQALGQTLEVAHLLGNIGTVRDLLSDYVGALDYMLQALAVIREEGMRGAEAHLLTNIGGVYHRVGDNQKSLATLEEALHINEELKIESGIAHVCGSLGLLYSDLQDEQRALKYYQRALDVYTRNKMHSKVAALLNNTANSYHNLGQHEEAARLYRSALELNREHNFTPGIARNCANLGRYCLKMKSFEEARSYFEEAYRLNKELDLHSDTGLQLVYYAELFLHEESPYFDRSRGKEMLLEAIVEIGKSGSTADIHSIYNRLAELSAQDSDWKQAHDYLQKHLEYAQQNQSEETKRQAQLVEYRRQIEESERDRQVRVARFQEQERILLDILPSTIAERIVQGENTIAERFESVSVFFADIENFTSLAVKLSPEKLVEVLNSVFTAFDVLAKKHGVEKIKTIGDAYMAASGTPNPDPDHVLKISRFAMDALEFMKSYTNPEVPQLAMRFGLHTGAVVGGIIGEHRYSYDLWGDTVNIASRMQSSGEVGRIHCSEEFYNAALQRDASLQFEERGQVEIKGRGPMKTYFLQSVA